MNYILNKRMDSIKHIMNLTAVTSPVLIIQSRKLSFANVYKYLIIIGIVIV